MRVGRDQEVAGSIPAGFVEIDHEILSTAILPSGDSKGGRVVRMCRVSYVTRTSD